MGRDDGKDPLLPIHERSQKTENNKSDLCFKAYVIVTMTFLWTGYTLTVRYTRSAIPSDQRYFPTTVVLLAEIIKLAISVAMIFRETNGRSGEFITTLHKYYFGAPRELMKMSVPSVAYALQNNLDFIALSNLDAGLYQITTQLKVVTTALFMMAFLGRKFSKTRWMAIFLLFLGVAAVQLNNANGQVPAKGAENYFVGITAVLATCLTAGFAGVYFEKMLKDGGNTPFWIRNMQMYSCGVVSAFLGCAVSEGGQIMEKGFFFGYDYRVYAIVGFLSIGGVYISLVMKHLDNMHKSYASAVSIILVVILSYLIFPDTFIGAYFVLGTFIVVGAVLLYNSVAD